MSNKMKILFVANRVPFPPFRGDKLKIYNLAKILRDKHEIHLIAIAENDADLSYRADLESIFHEVHFVKVPKWQSLLNVLLGFFQKGPLQVVYFRSKAFKKLLDSRLVTENYNAIHVQHLRMSQFFEDTDKSNVVLDLPDAFSLYWKRRAENARDIFKKWFARMEYARLLKYEKSTLVQFPLNLVCSDEDKLYLEQIAQAKIRVLPNGVDTELFTPKEGVNIVEKRILFTGNMDYEPNVDAVSYFVEEIFPLILQKIPNAIFVIAGQRPVPKVRKLASKNVLVTGFVEDISLEYAKADVVVAPLRFGAGTQNKVLEAMSVGVPVVCTDIGFKGLGIESGQGAVMVTDKVGFASEVSKLIINRDYRNRVSFTGRDIIQTRFSWQAVSKQLELYLAEVGR